MFVCPRPKDTENGASLEGKHLRPSIQLKIVDFANCVVGEDGIPSNAACPPEYPQNIDRGYLRGLRTPKTYSQRILHDINQEEYVESGEAVCRSTTG